VLTFLVDNNEAQNRVAPGVPPQSYQEQQNFQHQQQQFGQQPMHHQQQMPPQQQHHTQQQQFQQHQVPIQQQQQQQLGHGQAAAPVQQQQQHQQFQQQGGGHAHAGGHGQPQLLDTSNIGQERQHIQEHMDLPIDTSQMSEQELQFHYFKMHDSDHNNKLDGCELVKSLIHWHDQSNHDSKSGMPVPEPKVFTDDELSQMIDPILQNDDKNRDGFIDYSEFVQAQASAQANKPQHA